MKKFYLSFLVTLTFCIPVIAQYAITGKIYDSHTNEALIGANIVISGTTTGCITNTDGNFSLSFDSPIKEIQVSYVGYEKSIVSVSSDRISVALNPSVNSLQQVVVTANREASLRTESPLAISKVSAATISDTKPVLIIELINKIPGVVMLNYNNEQHAMSIRQPMGISAYFLYMEDGIPIRPMGIFNHNALIEMNVLSLSSVEVVKGPASSLYGPEAIGGAINFITHRPTVVPSIKVGMQADQWGYKRVQYAGGGMVTKKLGFYVSGFEARQQNSWQTFSDYDKSSVNIRGDYSITDRTKVTMAFSTNEYYSDMSGNVDSIAFYNRRYSSTTDFTYRKVHSQRTRLTFSHHWNSRNETTLTLGYRDNYIQQNPAYAIRWMSGSQVANGELNRNTFYSKIALLQHSLKFNFLQGRLMVGATIDKSPTNYWAYSIDLKAQLRPDGKSVEKFTLVKENPDKFLADYKANLVNSALYTQVELSPLERMKLTLGLRYDHMAFDYINYLTAATGRKSYQQFTPKIGLTYDLQKDKGLYVNYSRGFSPPGLTAIFRKKPSANPEAPAEFYYNLAPATFDNVEVGGWAALFQNKVYIDGAAYQMIGHRELLTIRQPDNSNDYQSAGKTLHRGIEYGITWQPSTQWAVRFGGTNAIHRFQEFTLSNRSSDEIKNVNGKDMPQSPRWIANSEITFKPAFISGFRIALEWQRIASWYQDQVNHVSYEDTGLFGLKGISYINLRTGYTWKRLELFTNIMNLTNELYANAAARGNGVNDRTTFTPAAPRTFVMGIQYNFTRSKNK